MPSTGVKTNRLGELYLEIDDFWQLKDSVLIAAGWNFDSASITRYNPTVITGAITPTGKTCSVTLSGNTITMTIGANQRQVTVNRSVWLDGNGTVTAIDTARNSFPANQR